MADVEFEPLHGENEEDSEFMLERRKKDSSAKKHKPKSGPLFQRKSMDKKDKTLVIDNSKALAASPSKAMHHHHHSRPVEGLVGPGDIQFGSSPPGVDDITSASLSQSTGSIPQTVNQKQAASWHHPPSQLALRLPPQPQWTQVQTQPSTGMFPPQQRSPSQEKLTLLDKAKMMTPTREMNSGLHDSFTTPDKMDNHRGFSTPNFNTTAGPLTPPRVASPTERGPFSPPTQQPLASPLERRFERSESWDPSRQYGHREENWADFSKSFDGSLSLEEEQMPRRRQSAVSTISEGSECSYVSEIEENDWRITEEQRIYYLAQFKKLQPNEKAVIKGPQARDFFLKSNLPVEVLSKIWHLSDLNKDSALDLEEFCIAMHLVVAVKHDVELPDVLPAVLIPTQKRNSVEASFEQAKEKAQQQQQQTTDDVNADDERPRSPPRASQNDQYWARFEDNAAKQVAMQDEQNDEMSKVTRVAEASVVSEQSMPITKKSDATAVTDDVNSNHEKTLTNQRDIVDENKGIQKEWAKVPDPATLEQPLLNKHPNETNNTRPEVGESPISKETVSKKGSIGIARPRGMGATINLIDTRPGQLLPPPEGKKSRKTVQQQQHLPHSLSSPPLSPTTKFSSDFSSVYEEPIRKMSDPVNPSESKSVDSNSTTSRDIDRTDGLQPPTDGYKPPSDGFQPPSDATQPPTDRSEPPTGGFQPPTLTPRNDAPTSTHSVRFKEVEKEAGDVTGAILRKGSISRKGGRPRSYTADSRSSMESLVDLPTRESKDIEAPPTPPPRKVRTHKRGSSLDLSKLFATKSLQKLDNFGISPIENTKLESLPPKMPSGDKKEDKKDKKSDLQIIARPRPAPQHHNRSTSCDNAQVIAPPPKTTEGTQGYRKPAPPKPSSLTRAGRSKSLERAYHTSNNEDLTFTDHKPTHLSRPLRKKRQRQEIQAAIRALRDKNTTLSSLNGEFQQELKDAMEARTKLELQLTKLKQLPE